MPNILLPNWLYYFNDSKSKSVSPTASFSPAGALRDNPFQNSSSPSKSPTKKTIIIEKPLYYGPSFTGNTIAFIKKLKILGFDVQLCLADGQFYKVDDDLNNISKLLPELATFDPNKDYQSLGIARQNVEILDNKKIEEITDCFRRESVSGYDEMSSIDGFEAIVPLEVEKIRDGDFDDCLFILIHFDNFLFTLQNAKIGDKLGIIEANKGNITNCDNLLRTIKVVPQQMVKGLIIDKKDLIKDEKKLLTTVIAIAGSQPEFAKELIIDKKDLIKNGTMLSMIVRAISDSLPEFAKELITDKKNLIINSAKLSDILNIIAGFQPDFVKELITDKKDLITDDIVTAIAGSLPEFANELIKEHQIKIQNVIQLKVIIKAAPQMAKELIKEHQDKIQNGFQLAQVIKAAPQMAKELIKQHQSKIQNGSQLATVIQAAPQMAKELIEKHQDKIKDGSQLEVIIKAAPQMAEELIEKYKDKIRNHFELASVIRAAPQLTKKLLEFTSIKEYSITLPDGAEQAELKRAISYKNKGPKLDDAPKAPSKQDYQEEESSARPTCLAIPMFNIDSKADKDFTLSINSNEGQYSDITTIKIYGVNANNDAKKQEVLSFLIEVCQRNKNIKHLILPIELMGALRDGELKFPDSVGVDYINYNNYLGLPTVQKENDNFGNNWNSSGTDIGISRPSSKPDNKIRIADNGLSKKMEAASGEKSTFEMVSAGEVLNGYSNGLQIRTGIIKRDISKSFDQEHYVPEDNKYEIQEVSTIHDVNLYKQRGNGSNNRFCLFKQSLEAGKRYRLLSSSASEKFIGILNDKSGVTIEKGDDGFFYATSTSNRVLEYIVSSPFKESSLDNLDQNNPIRKIIEEYKDKEKGYKDISDPHEKLEEPVAEDRKKWLEKVYQDRSGSCRHRVAAVEYKLSQIAGITKDQYRVVTINNNHVILEVKNQNNDGWIPIDLGGAEGKSSNVDNDKKYSGGAINKGEGLKAKKWGKQQKEKQRDEEQQREYLEQEELELNPNPNPNPNPELEELEIKRIKNLQESFDKLLAPKETIQSTEELLKNTLGFQSQDKREEEEAELEPKPENNKKGKKILITTNNKESITNHANFLIKKAIADNRPVFYIDSPDKIDIKPKIDQENPPKHLFIDENGNPTLRIIGLLEKFLQENKTNENGKKPLIIINWESFSPSEKLALNTLVDENKTINGVAIADHIEIIGLTCGDQKDHSFISRHNKYLKSSVSPNDLNKVVNTGQNSDQENQDQTEIDLQGFPRWKEELFGKVILNGNKMVWKKSPFVEALENNKTNFKISNLLPEAIEELKYQIANSKAQGHFLYHGYKINIPQNLKIDFNAKAFDFAKFNQADVIEISTNQTRDLIPENTHLVNSYLFDHLLQDKEIKDGKYEEKAGLIELASNKDDERSKFFINSLQGEKGEETKAQLIERGMSNAKISKLLINLRSRCDKPLKLFITSDLSQNQWYCLFEQAKQRGVKLDLYLAPEVKIPADIKFTKKEEKKETEEEKVVAPKSVQQPRIFISNNTNKTVNEIARRLGPENGKKTPIIIDIEDFGYQDLVKRTTFTTGESNFEEFQEIESEVLERLEKELNDGNQVIIKGQFSTDLLKMLEPLIAGLDPQFANVSQNLILIIEEKANNLPKENLIYKPLNWLPRSSYIKHECATESKEALSANQEYRESKPTEELNLDNSKAESEAFIKARKNQFLELLGKSPMLQLVGHSGVGKSRLLKMLEEDDKTTNVYRELANFENWAKDKNKINKILFIDESNIEDMHFTSLSGLLKGGKKEILYKGKIYELDENHKVVFAFNPVEYGGGRFKQKLFDTYQIPKIYLEDFPASYIYEKILKEAVYDKSGQDIKDAVSEEDFKKKAIELIKEYQETNKNPDPKKHLTVRELQEQALSYLSKEANKNKVKTELKSKNFISTLATKQVEESLQSCLDIRKQQRDGSLPSDGIGINGVLLEGASGTGKSEMIIALLESREIKLVDKDHDEKSNNQVCYKIDASMPLMQKTDIIIKAFENGDIIWIDEINSCIDDGLEKILNAVLTGQHPRSSDANIKPGFTLLASANSLNLEGRSAISPALRHRLLLPEVKELKEYSPEDLTKIVSHWIEQDEELKQKISDQEGVNQKVIVATFDSWIEQDNQEDVNQKVIVAKNIANDFHELLQKPENSSLNLRMLKKMMPEKVLSEEYVGNLIDHEGDQRKKFGASPDEGNDLSDSETPKSSVSKPLHKEITGAGMER